MAYGLVVTSQPAVEPLSLEETRRHLELHESQTSDDTLIQGLIQAAREHVEQETHRALISQTCRLTLPGFPCGREPLWIPRPPFASLTSITYYDTDNAQQTLTTTGYGVSTDHEPGFVQPPYDAWWPSTICREDAVKVTFVAGYGASGSSVPRALRQAMLLIVGRWYETRVEDVESQRQRWADIPAGAQRMISNFVIGDAWVDYAAG